MTVAVRNRQRRRRIPVRKLASLAHRAAELVRCRRAILSIVLVGDREMARHNAQFHGVAGPTDILTFDYGDTGELIISADHAAANAKRYRTTLARELALYIVHGLLHLAGYNDRTPAQRRRMRAAERATLRRLESR